MKKTTLLPCPICRQPARLEEGVQDFAVACSEDCPAPRCVHFNSEHTVLSWNDFARWYSTCAKNKE